MTRPHDFVIVGAGALGSVLAAHLERAGHSVAVLARGRRAAHLRERGLEITGLANFSAPCRVLGDASEIDAQVLIVATKTPGMAATFADLARGRTDTVFSIQNGMEKDELLCRHFGADRVLGAIADTSAEMLTAGEVRFTRNVNISIGELDGRAGGRAEGIARVIDASGVRAQARANIRALEWSKFAAWAGMMILSVTTRSASWKFLSDAHGASLIARLVREIGAIAAAEGVALTDDAVLPVASIARGTEQDGVGRVVEFGTALAASAPLHRMSSLQDLEAGRALEVEETLGFAARKAASHAIRTPLLDACYTLAGAIDAVRRSDGP